MVLALLIVAVASLLALAALCVLDRCANQSHWRHLQALQPQNPARFDPVMLAGLPPAAQRYFQFAIEPGTPLLTVAELAMTGEFSLGSRERPAYQSMQARQILAAPDGFVWAMRLRGMALISGSDSDRWTRFRVFGLLPVARMGDSLWQRAGSHPTICDHTRAAYGRYIAEALFWTPAALLPGPGVQWDDVDANHARVTVTHGALSQTVDLYVDAEGRPTTVSFLRWSNANPQKQYGWQPFGGVLSDFRQVQGFWLPFDVQAANLFGTDQAFVFFKARVTSIVFPTQA